MKNRSTIGKVIFLTMTLLIVVAIPGIYQTFNSQQYNEPVLTSTSLKGMTNVTSSKITQSSAGFLDKTLVLSNNTLFPGDFLKRNNNSMEPMYAAFDPVNSNLYVSVNNTKQVVVINGTSNRIQDHINVGGSPFGIAFDPLNKYVYVTDISSRNVSVINPQNNSVIKNLTVGNNPYAMAFDPQNGNLYVTDSNTTTLITSNPGEVSVINSTTNTVVSNFTVGSDPQGIAYDPANGELFIAMAAGGYVQASNFQTGTVYLWGGSHIYQIGNRPYYMQIPTTLSYNPSNQLMYMGDAFSGDVFGVNQSNQIVSVVREGIQNSMFYDSANGYTYVVNGMRGVYGEVSAIDPATNSDVSRLWIGRYPNGYAQGSAFDPQNGAFYVANSVAGTLAIFQSYGPSNITFKSTGLMGGPSWSVTFNGVELQSTLQNIQFNQQNGTYAYSIQVPGGYMLFGPDHGNVSLTGAPVTITVHFISDYILIALAVGITASLIAIVYLVQKRQRS